MSSEKKIKVLVVDDESDMVIFLSTLLNAHGFDSIIAGDGQEGFEKARKESPACIILNAMMSDDSGIDLYVRLKRDQHLRNVPVIMLSAIASKTFFQYRKFQGISSAGQGIPEPEAYLESPPETGELIWQVQELVSEK